MMGSGLGFKNVSMYEPSQMSSNFKKKKNKHDTISGQDICRGYHGYSSYVQYRIIPLKMTLDEILRIIRNSVAQLQYSTLFSHQHRHS